MVIEWKSIRLLRESGYSNKKLLTNFSQEYGFDRCAEYDRPHSLVRLLNNDRAYNAGISYDSPDSSQWLDHAQLFRDQQTGRTVVTGQNYGSYADTKAKIAPVIKSLSLRAVLFDRKESWFYPQQTMLVMVMTPTTYIAYKEHLLASQHVIELM